MNGSTSAEFGSIHPSSLPPTLFDALLCLRMRKRRKETRQTETGGVCHIFLCLFLSSARSGRRGLTPVLVGMPWET